MEEGNQRWRTEFALWQPIPAQVPSVGVERDGSKKSRFTSDFGASQPIVRPCVERLPLDIRSDS